LDPTEASIGAIHPIPAIGSSVVDAGSGAPGPNAVAPAGGIGVTSLDWARVLHRGLRGRYRLAIGLALVFAVVGATVGWRWAGPLYRSEGMVRIASAMPAVLQPTDQNQPIPMFESFIQAQQGVVTSRPVLEGALNDPIWNASGVAGRRPSIEEMSEKLKVEIRPRSENLRISYTDGSEAVATTAVTSTINSYQTVFETDHDRFEQQRLKLLLDYRHRLASQLGLSDGATTQPDSSGSTTIGSTSAAESARTRLTAEKLAVFDLEMRKLVDDREHAKDDLDQASVYDGAQNPLVVSRRLVFDHAARRVQEYLNNYLEYHAAAGNVPVALGDTQSRATTPTPNQAGVAPAEPMSASTEQLQSALQDVDRRIEVLKAEAAMPKRFEVVSRGDLPAAIAGRQIKIAACAGMMCGWLPVGIIALTGLVRRRLNRCADVTDDLGQRARFIAAIPYLEATTKLDRWADAAQCVHRLRETLARDSKVYLVTSADWSEGRTSVTMSLALSLWGAGARTLVVDADLMTRGLSGALRMDNARGFFELLADNDSTTAIMPTSTALSILPVGEVTEADGASVSGPTLERLLGRLRSRFDVVLIDAGPVLGRIETCLIARQADGVLFTIGRGQKQSLVESALAELEMAKATVTGIIFNSVEGSDFDRTIQRRRPASAPPAQSRPVAAPLHRFGLLVWAVAMSLTKDAEISRAGDESGESAASAPTSTDSGDLLMWAA
jgi:Mrp family chromosome partitioning ATPase